jgi:protein gp37
MYREKTRYGQRPDVVVRSKAPTFDAPFKWTDPAFVFCPSWSDFFVEEADPWRAEAWGIIRTLRHLTFQIPTKRVHRIAECLPPDWGSGWPNVWLGVSVEDQQWADERIPALLSVDSAVHFVSAEPLLGPVVLDPDMDVDWVICGGESGPKCRPMDETWARILLGAARNVGAAFFMKQLGGHPNKRDRLEDFPADLRIREFPEVTP